MLEAWSSFFQGELGAAAALAGLLFVSVSVNQAKILELGRMADRGLEALGILFLIIMVTSLPLVPGQPLRLLGAEILVLGTIALIVTVLLQRSYMRHVEQPYRRSSMKTVAINRLAVSVIALAGLTLLWRGDGAGLYVLPAGILLSLFAASAGAWVLLVEINR
jgi:preprotein translocase subunit SecG